MHESNLKYTATNRTNHQQYSIQRTLHQQFTPVDWNSKKVHPEYNSQEAFVANSTYQATYPNTTSLQNSERQVFLAEIVNYISNVMRVPEECLQDIDIMNTDIKIETEILAYFTSKGYSSAGMKKRLDRLKKKSSRGLYYILSKLTKKIINKPNKYLNIKLSSQIQPDIEPHKEEPIIKTESTKNSSDFKTNIAIAYKSIHPNKKIFITSTFFSNYIDFLLNDKNLPINDACNIALEIASESTTLYNFHCLSINFFEQKRHLLADNNQVDKDTSNHIQQTTKAPEFTANTREISTLENISLSPMTNLGNTCWCNTGFKFMLHYFGIVAIKKAINTKIDACDTSTHIGRCRITVLKKLDILFDDLSTNKPIFNQMQNFFIAINHYIQKIDKLETKEDFIKDIFNFIKPAFREKHRKPNFTKIPQEDPERLFLHLSNLLDLFDDTNRVQYKQFKQFTFNNSDLKKIGISLTSNQLTLDIEYPEEICFIRTMNNKEEYIPQAEEITVKTFIEYLNRSTNTQFSKRTLSDISKHAKDFDENIKISCESVLKKTTPIVDIQTFTDFIFNVDSQHYNRNWEIVRDADEIKSFVIQAFQQTQMTVLDKETNQQHILHTRPSTIIMRKGLETYGHYFTISIDSRQNFWVQNDTSNDSMEDAFIKTIPYFDKSKELAYFRSKNRLDQLLIFMDRIKAYPTTIGYFVV